MKPLVTLSLVTACRSHKPLVTVPVETKTIIRDRLVEVQTPADSAWLVAYLECDSNYNVLVTSMSEKATKGMQTSIEQSSLTPAVERLNREGAKVSYERMEKARAGADDVKYRATRK